MLRHESACKNNSAILQKIKYVLHKQKTQNIPNGHFLVIAYEKHETTYFSDQIKSNCCLKLLIPVTSIACKCSCVKTDR